MALGCRYTTFVDAPDSTHNRVVELVPEGSRVLEFGCATGYMSEVLKVRRRCTVTGIEISPEAAELAEQHADRIIVGDAETLDYETLLGDEEFGAVLFADILEHLRRPANLLMRIRPFVAEEGVVVASIPNVAHGSLRLALMAGEFRYRPLGLLDETHLRFFTRESVQDLFESSGFAIRRWFRQRLDVTATEIAVPAGAVPDDVLGWLRADPEATTYQFVVEAFRSDAAGQLLAARDAASHQVEARLERLEQTKKEQSDQIAALRERAEFSMGREQELDRLLRDAHERLVRRDEEIRQLAEGEIRDRDQRLASLEQQLRDANHVIHMMQSTRVWRIGHGYWRFRSGAKRLLGRE